jgi:hypothetical protein
VHPVCALLAVGIADAFPFSAGMADVAALHDSGVYDWLDLQVHQRGVPIAVSNRSGGLVYRPDRLISSLSSGVMSTMAYRSMLAMVISSRISTKFW